MEQNSPAPQAPSQREPQPSGVPQGFPAQFGTHVLHVSLLFGFVTHVWQLPWEQYWHVLPPIVIAPPHATP